MTILIIILLTISATLIGKRSETMGMKEYMIIFLITLLQAAFFILVFWTMEAPPGF